MKYQITWKQYQDKKKQANSEAELISGYIAFGLFGAFLGWAIAYLL